jgi:YVTN family beta-propeller protein
MNRQRNQLAVLFAIATLLVVTPHAARAGKQMLWVENAYGNDIHVIDVATQEVVKHLIVGDNPHGIAAAADASVVYIALEKFKKPAGELLWINPRTYKITHRIEVGPEPNEIECTPDGRWIYVPCKDGKYWVVDGREKKVVSKIITGGRPHNTVVSADGRRMYLSPMGSPKRVTIVDISAGHKVIGEIPYSNVCRPPAMASDERRFFQQIDGLLGFQVADIGKREVIATVRHVIPQELQQKASRCHGLAVRPDQKEIWSCNVEHHLVHIHDITQPDYPEIAVLPMLDRIYWMCFTPDSKYAYISVRGADKVCVVECATKTILKHIEVGNTPKRSQVIVLPD